MELLSDQGWINFVRIKSDWIDKLLIRHGISESEKIVTRAFSIKFCGTEEDMQSLVEFMAPKIKQFVLSDKEIEEYVRQDKEPWIIAAKYFGPVNPQTEGKYGELLLFLLVEAVLKTPMIAHKMKSLDDYNQQVKGSDGVFFGNYRGNESLLLGEAKIYQNRNDAIDKALKSVDKFHNDTAHPEISNELLIIKQTISKDLSREQFDFLLKLVDIQSPEYKRVNKVHPILIVYDEKKITDIQQKCNDSHEGEDLICSEFKELSGNVIPTINDLINEQWKCCKKVHLDFFFIPVSSVKKFKNSLFREIHNADYKK